MRIAKKLFESVAELKYLIVRNEYYDLKLSSRQILIKFSWAVSHVSCLKIYVSGTSSIPIIRIMM
jgi:hypothetical protein